MRQVQRPVESNHGDTLLRWHPELEVSAERITQVRGYIFNSSGEILIVEVAGKHWSTVGGSVESFDKTPLDAFRREVAEETYVEIENEIILGYIEVILPGGATHHQARYAAKLKRELAFEPKHETTARKWVLPANISFYIPWTKGNPVFDAEIEAALIFYGKVRNR